MNKAFTTFIITFIAGLAAILVFPYYVINPGVLIEDHLKLKNDCFACHTLGEGAVTEKCFSCHKINAIGLANTEGMVRTNQNMRSNTLHNSILNIQCYDCHTEHSGLSRKNATLKFRHNVLSEESQKKCNSCHSHQKPKDEIHINFSAECSGCHSPAAWRPSHFKHDLLGDKKNECRSCHENKKPGDALHKELGKAIQCVQCHTNERWKPSTFDHTKHFRFDRKHPSDCSGCHYISRTFDTYTCYNCHEHSPARIEKKHLKEGIKVFDDCVKCHRSGDEKEVKVREDRRGKDERDDD